jgi:hypothetical protein
MGLAYSSRSQAVRLHVGPIKAYLYLQSKLLIFQTNKCALDLNA